MTGPSIGPRLQGCGEERTVCSRANSVSGARKQSRYAVTLWRHFSTFKWPIGHESNMVTFPIAFLLANVCGVGIYNKVQKKKVIKMTG
jgi:hypothetical protein